MSDFVKKLTSRKFLVAVGAFIVGLCGVFKPDSEVQAAAIVEQVTEGILLLAPVIYIVVEGYVDGQN